MAKRRMGILIFLLYICLCLMPCYVEAASTSDAKESIVPNRECTLTLSYLNGETPCADMAVKLYRVADVSADFRYALTEPFRTTGYDFNGIRSVSEWDRIRSSLEAKILVGRIGELSKASTDQDGKVSFEDLTPGMYLIIPSGIFDASLVALPELGTDGLWKYQVAVSPKPVDLPIDPDDIEEVTFKVLKLWKGDDQANRPKSVGIEIFRNETSYKTVTLSDENQWAYSWTVKKDDARWSVAERNTPAGYSAQVEKRGTSFVLTNTLIPETPEEQPPKEETPPGEEQPPASGNQQSSKPPKTGDTSNILLYVILLHVSGIILILIGVNGKRKQI